MVKLILTLLGPDFFEPFQDQGGEGEGVEKSC